MMKEIGLLIFSIACFILAGAQLKEGFDKEEYKKLISVTAQFGSGAHADSLSPGSKYHLLYNSPEIGLKNKWQLWKSDEGPAIISIRGTTKDNLSWLANFYAAMIPAKGELQLTKDYKFSYQLSSHPHAAVHVGWTVALGFLVRDMKPNLDSILQSGTKDILIVGHSQGGAIAYLLTAYLRQLQLKNEFPQDIRIKTYCSAAPKPGNCYFAYEYESMTQGGWAFNVINAADWVPQTPFSAQGISDFNEVNPFVDTKTVIKKKGWPERWALNYGYGKMKKPAKKAVKTYQKYLGDFVSKSVKKSLDGFDPPDYYPSSDYVRTGTTIVLYPDEEYYKKYHQDKNNAFINHGLIPYLFLANKLP